MTSSSPQPSISGPRLRLETVTLVAVSSSNLVATVAAMRASLAQIEFAQALLFTDAEPSTLGLMDADEIKVIPIEKIRSAEAYSHFMLERLADHIATDHCLVIQWDGHVIDASRWQPEFLDYDYIGASWPQFDDGYDVGNGGFSLRSRRLLQACQALEFKRCHPEDVAIGRTNRAWLEEQGLRFAPAELADRFSAERASDPYRTFGYHGVFLMPKVLGQEAFWQIYKDLSDRSSVRVDLVKVFDAVRRGPSGLGRAVKLVIDQISRDTDR